MKTYSVSEIAEKIRRPGEDLRVVGDRIRNWTREGLLDPAGEKHPGTGRKRVYPASAMLNAVLLQVLTDAVGVSAVRAHKLLKDTRKNIGSAKPTEGAVIVISKAIGAEDFMVSNSNVSNLDVWLPKCGGETHTVLMLDRLFEHFEGVE